MKSPKRVWVTSIPRVRPRTLHLIKVLAKRRGLSTREWVGLALDEAVTAEVGRLTTAVKENP